MKKLVCLLMLFALGCPVLAEIQPPQWSEFCPSEYVNAEYIQDNTFPNWANALLACSIVGLPIAVHDKNKYDYIATNNYWVDRRHNFESKLKSCDGITNENELMYKYLSIRQAEAINDNNLRLNVIAARQSALASRQNWQFINSQSQINQLNNYNNFNRIGF